MRESPTCASIALRSSLSSTVDAVVAMPRRSMAAATSSARRRLARWKALLRRLPSMPRAGSTGWGQVSPDASLAVSQMKASIASTAIFEATSPATWPPIPSATMNRPRSGREQNASSLDVRRMPGCVVAAHWTGIRRLSLSGPGLRCDHKARRGLCESFPGRLYVGLGPTRGEALFGPFLGRPGLGHVDFFGPLGHLGQHGDPVRQRLGEAVGDGHIAALLALAVGQNAHL